MFIAITYEICFDTLTLPFWGNHSIHYVRLSSNGEQNSFMKVYARGISTSATREQKIKSDFFSQTSFHEENFKRFVRKLEMRRA